MWYVSTGMGLNLTLPNSSNAQAELELRDDLVEKLESITLPVDDLNLNLDTLRQDVTALQQQVFDQQARVLACIQYGGKRKHTHVTHARTHSRTRSHTHIHSHIQICMS